MNNGERLDALLDEASERIGKRGDDLFDKYGVRTHWCLMMVYDIMAVKLGIPDFPKIFSCSAAKVSEFFKKRLNHEFSTAEVGDIILFENNGNRMDGPDHVGIVVANSGTHITVLEGNTAGDWTDWYNTSTANEYTYSYDNPEFDCIIDMSEFFSNESSEPEPLAVAEPDEEIKPAFLIELKTLKSGMTGDAVKALQRLLFADGYSVGPCGDDGDFGPATERAVKRYQKEHKLTVNGIVTCEMFKILLGVGDN